MCKVIGWISVLGRTPPVRFSPATSMIIFTCGRCYHHRCSEDCVKPRLTSPKGKNSLSFGEG